MVIKYKTNADVKIEENNIIHISLTQKKCICKDHENDERLKEDKSYIKEIMKLLEIQDLSVVDDVILKNYLLLLRRGYSWEDYTMKQFKKAMKYIDNKYVKQFKL